MQFRCLFIVSFLFVIPFVITGSRRYSEENEDNEFAEFEEFEDEVKPTKEKEQTKSEENVQPESQTEANNDDGFDEETDMDGVVEDEDNEFEHFQDEEEFEGFDGDKVGFSIKMDDKEGPKITIAKVPLHFRSNWDSFYLEILMLAGLVVYFINFFTGKAKNSKMANVWYSTHKSILEENFSLVGDDGKMEIENRGLMKESEHLYTLWCSGRTCCEGMLVELKFMKRQDLVAVIGQMMRPVQDQILIKVEMNKDEMDSFVFCVATKKTAIRLVKDMADISTYSPERRCGEKHGLPTQFCVMSELAEASSALLDSRMVSFINKYSNLIDYIHFSDQFSGVKQQEESSVTKLPATRKVLMFGINIPVKGQPVSDAMEAVKPVMSLVLYSMEKVRRMRLSKEARAKADKNRAKVEETFLKNTHAARAEAAAARREEKRRQEKERILQEDDPEKQRKWEEKELKRQMKKKAPKMKQLKVKAL